MLKRRSNPSFAVADDAPFSVINTTPLIDVMLVLLIMFIITIPITTHKVPLDLPQGGAAADKPLVHRLDLDAAGRISLDRAAVGQAELGARLSAIAAGPVSDLVLRVDGAAPYEPFDQVMAIVKRAGITRLGMAGNEKFVASLN